MVAPIRPVRPHEVPVLADIEDDADRLLIALLEADPWEPASSEPARWAVPGFVLVAGEALDGPPVGFVHVLEVDGLAHLDQLAVRPASGRRGHGRSLMEAAKAEAARRGYRRVTLRTYAEVPWNAPFYATCGFAESEPDHAFLRELQRREAAVGLDRYGRRVQMTANIRIPAAEERR